VINYRLRTVAQRSSARMCGSRYGSNKKLMRAVAFNLVDFDHILIGETVKSLADQFAGGVNGIGNPVQCEFTAQRDTGQKRC